MATIKSFRLLKPIGDFKVGKKFDHFGGIVSGVDKINFTNKEYFEPVYARKKYSISQSDLISLIQAEADKKKLKILKCNKGASSGCPYVKVYMQDLKQAETLRSALAKKKNPNAKLSFGDINHKLSKPEFLITIWE